ncbi:MAG TPA: hypothetical protein EYQ73_00070 [Candidatus Poseidoniales archaeon]|nr:MAG: hypothetical protein CXT71_05930 [Euryarchaeota archaeon]HIF45186.1 hypothetical protein [Candidatus Poseidoniales archaeon]HIL64750.1 hypothetical protein [Candidatus Poseidoniales archaeon]
MDDDILEQYRREAADALAIESSKRIAESTNLEEEERLRDLSLIGLTDLVPALLSRLGPVRAALDGHGGEILISSKIESNNCLQLVLDLGGACISCGAAPGTLQGIKNDLENDPEIDSIKFTKSLLDTFDDLGREFVLAHGGVDFV